jgi:hypothetical protein
VALYQLSYFRNSKKLAYTNLDSNDLASIVKRVQI